MNGDRGPGREKEDAAVLQFFLTLDRRKAMSSDTSSSCDRYDDGATGPCGPSSDGLNENEKNCGVDL